jgi:hypothetical protein
MIESDSVTYYAFRNYQIIKYVIRDKWGNIHAVIYNIIYRFKNIQGLFTIMGDTLKLYQASCLSGLGGYVDFVFGFGYF